MMRRRWIQIGLLCLAPAVAWGGFAEADAALLRGDYVTAEVEYRKLAEAGEAEAEFNLGVLYHNGYGVARNDVEALKWSLRAAERGYAKAQYHLGLIYSNGQGVPQNDAEALKWYRLAAEQAFASAQYNLGFMYAKGQGMVHKDYVQAYLWWSLAALGYENSQDREAALKSINVLRGLMTPAQTAEGQRRVTEWKPK